ncbi:MAG TPA: DNA mismatch repair protein MutS [Treponema sp.]|nr:DNA mismatch repair protein MutS [Treponema sp.]
MSDDTPLFVQYQKLKDAHPGTVLFFHLGDFYEMFGDDALEVSKLLNLTLTHRGERPMCGIPHHAAKAYIARLLRAGKKIAVAEQVGEIAHGKGLTERKVMEIITPGTALESEYLEGGGNNFLASCCVVRGQLAFAYIDVTTGEFRATHFSASSLAENFTKELGRCRPRELLLPVSLKEDAAVQQALELTAGLSVSYYPDWHFQLDTGYERLTRHFATANLRSFSLTRESPELAPAGFLLDYLSKTTNASSPHVGAITVYEDSQYVIIDDSSRKNLEITENLRDGGMAFSLLGCLNCTCTAMGIRMLREWLVFPLRDAALIRSRQEHVELFAADRALLKNIRARLDDILDIERLAGRIAMDRAHAKDLKALQHSLSRWLEAQELLGRMDFVSLDGEPARRIVELIGSAILDDPATVLSEGGVIRPGWSQELDHWRDVHDNFNKVLDDYAEEERRATGIQNLRIRKNGNMGYYIEISKGKLAHVPSHFIMRRALVNAERFTTEKLQELEQSLNESGSRILELERDLFLEVRSSLKQHVPYLQQAAAEIAYADVTSSLAQVALKYGWVRPEVDDGPEFEVRGGRHPVVEQHLPSGEFVPNDLFLAGAEGEQRPFFALITGPNMAGKSTFLRQNALIALLAQIGSFVPCSSARLGIVDRIFCRVGASDNLARGESTFLVEMTETARILRSATEKSLVIMDEVGRGTSTEDGLSIAWAVSEHLLNSIRCKTLFATHYHELTRLEHPALQKLCMAVSEEGADIVFLRKVCAGASGNSYGIHVARLAGIPAPVILRAEAILSRIQQDASDRPIVPETTAVREDTGRPGESAAQSLTGALFSDEELVLDEILSCSPDEMTPIAALQALMRWKHQLSGN